MSYKAVATNRNESIDQGHGYLEGLRDQVYIGDEYIELVINNIENGAWQNEPIIWACEQDHSSLTGGHYAAAKTITFDQFDFNTSGYSAEDVIILNNDKEEYIDLLEYKSNHIFRGSLYPHPLPLLSNVSNVAIEKDDFTAIVKNRGIWCGDRLSIERDLHAIPHDYRNISNICFSENEKEHIARKDVMRSSSMSKKKVSMHSNEPIHTKHLGVGSSKETIIKFLKSGDVIELRFTKVNGERVNRFATLNKEYNSISDYTTEDTSYLYFYDLEDNHIKKMKFCNFISATQVD